MIRCYACSQENCDSPAVWCSCPCHGQTAEPPTPKRKCALHPRYQVKRKPRAACEDCWRLWLGRDS